jgi:hypothetical protein
VVEVTVNGDVPVDTVDTNTEPVILPVVVRLVPVAAPMFGVIKAGLIENTKEPVPVGSVITVPSSAEVVIANSDNLFSRKAIVPVLSGKVRVLLAVGSGADRVVLKPPPVAPSNTIGLDPDIIPDNKIEFNALPIVTPPAPPVAIFTELAPLPVPILTVWATVDDPNVRVPFEDPPPRVRLLPASFIVVLPVSAPPNVTTCPARVNPLEKLNGDS